MKTTYYPQDDILEIRLSEKPIVREVSQDWNVNLSFAADGSVVELVILDAVEGGWRSVASLLAKDGRHDLADDVRRFIAQMPSARTERELIAAKLLERAHRRIREGATR